MSNLAQSLSIFMLICAVPIVGLAGYGFRYRDNLGVRGFLLCLIGMGGWSVLIALVTWDTACADQHPVDVSAPVPYAGVFWLAVARLGVP